MDALASRMDTAAPATAQLTRILQEWSAGDHAALERLTPLVYAELHRIAESKMLREQHGNLLQPSALVNEAFLRLAGAAPVDWKNRAHFFAHSARIMRHVLVDFARKRRIPGADLSSIGDPGANEPVRAEFLDVDAAVTELANFVVGEYHGRALVRIMT